MVVFLQELAAAAAEPALMRFRQNGHVENKSSLDFDPVTEADRNAELAIRALIKARFPTHGIVGEEFGVEQGDAEFVWVIDPIDGTRAYISGLPTWGTLVGLLQHGRAVAGLISQPFTGEVFVAGSDGAFFSRAGAPLLPIRTRQTKALSDATLMTTSPALYSGVSADRYAALEAKVKLVRYGLDCYAFAMLAAGHADLVVEPELQTYDIAGVIAVIEQAGGVVTTWSGERAETGGNVVAAATADLHAAAMAVLAEQS
ncbi:MAG: histidinol-phosphatase [Pseudomonadota bacterium]